jgi:hypothetical protein
MSGDDRARHCQECNLNVYNLSEMTRADAERLIASREGRLCVRFYRRVDGTIITRDCPKGLRALAERVSRIAGVVLSAMMTAVSAFSQTPAKTLPETRIQSGQPRLSVALTVVDPTGAVIQHASVMLSDSSGRIVRELNTNSVGAVRFTGLTRGVYKLKVEARGFKSTDHPVTLMDAKTEHLRMKLQIARVTTTVDIFVNQGVIMVETRPVAAPIEFR